MRTEIEAGEIVRRATLLIERNVSTGLVALLALTAPNVVADLIPELAPLFILLGIPLYWISKLLLIRTALVSAGVPLATREGIGKSFLGTDLFTGFVVGLASLLLIVPGIYLQLRWWIAIPIVVADGEHTEQAMAISQERAEGNYWQLFFALLVLGLPWLLGVALMAYAGITAASLGLFVSVLINALISAGFVGCWFGAVAAYTVTRPTLGLEEVFA